MRGCLQTVLFYIIFVGIRQFIPESVFEFDNCKETKDDDDTDDGPGAVDNVAGKDWRGTGNGVCFWLLR